MYMEEELIEKMFRAAYMGRLSLLLVCSESVNLFSVSQSICFSDFLRLLI